MVDTIEYAQRLSTSYLKIAETTRQLWDIKSPKTISLAIGEAIDIDPTHGMGWVFRLVSYEEFPRGNTSAAITFVRRADGSVTHKTPEQLDPFEVNFRLHQAENVAAVLVGLTAA